MRVCAAALLLSVAHTACTAEPEDEPETPAQAPPDIGFVLDESSFRGPPVPDTMVPFDIVTADLELDGDPDLLVSWHNLAPLELFANQGGGFYRINGPGADRAGLYENRGIPSLYGVNAAMLEKARALGVPGVFVWHEPNRRGDWQIAVVPGAVPVTLRLRGNGDLTPRVDEQFVQARGPMQAELLVDRELHFGADVAWVASQLVVEASVPVFAGADLTEVGERAVLWKDDPHGMAWVDAAGGAEPDLFITRGGLMGSLQPPLDAKRDRFFEYTGAVPLYADVRDLIPTGYGRGRRVEWVDVDADGDNELYIGNTDTPNVLLRRADDGTYDDVAADLGVDYREGDVFAWIDIDGDGFDDLVYIDTAGFHVAWNRGGARFESTGGEEVGLAFPGGAPQPSAELFEAMAINVLDFDSDGVLDLWLSGHGDQRRHALFRGSGGSYQQVTGELGLDTQVLSNRIAFLDIENDGYIDGLSLGAEAVWLHNRGGRRFTAESVDEGWRLREFTHAMPLDADGDGRLDVALLDRRRMVARNVSAAAGEALRVVLRGERGDPVGAVVTAAYSNGMTVAQRFGSARMTKLSQGTAPLHFGIPAGVTIERLEVRWPGGHVETRAVDAEDSIIELRR